MMRRLPALHAPSRAQLSEFAVEGGLFGLCAELVALPAHRARHVAVAMWFPAVHNDFVRRVRTAVTARNLNLRERAHNKSRHATAE